VWEQSFGEWDMSMNMQNLFTDEMHQVLLWCHTDYPVALENADLTRPFVYDRKYGVFYVPMGYHQVTMSTLLAFHFGIVCPLDVAKKLKLVFPSETADYWLEHIAGTAFKSSCTKNVLVSHCSNLNTREKLFFRHITACFEP
jgi:hypothetical protein